MVVTLHAMGYLLYVRPMGQYLLSTFCMLSSVLELCLLI